MIGGNKKALIQVSTAAKNEIGETVRAWKDAAEIIGWLDLSGGSTDYLNFNAKIQESTHVFVADYVALDSQITAENARMIIEGGRYDITLIDDPMELHKQLEIFLKYTGGQ